MNGVTMAKSKQDTPEASVKKRRKTIKYVPKEVILTAAQARCALRKWQNILNLRDWQLNVKICTGGFDEESTHLAEVHSEAQNRRAVIHLRQPGTFQSEYKRDMELDLVHELVHVVFWWLSVEDNEAFAILNEQSIESTAQAFITIDRCE